MANVIVVAVVIVLLGFALKGTLKHLKGESPCFGYGSDAVIAVHTRNFHGLFADDRTIQLFILNKIDGASAKVNLKKKEAVVSYEKVVEDAAIREAVEKAGYTVQSIQG